MTHAPQWKDRISNSKQALTLKTKGCQALSAACRGKRAHSFVCHPLCEPWTFAENSRRSRRERARSSNAPT